MLLIMAWDSSLVLTANRFVLLIHKILIDTACGGKYLYGNVVGTKLKLEYGVVLLW